MNGRLRFMVWSLVWTVVLGSGSLWFSSPAGADNYIAVWGTNGGPVELVDVANDSGNYIYLYQGAYGGGGSYGDNEAAPGAGGWARSILNGLSLGNYSTYYDVGGSGGAGGYADGSSTVNGCGGAGGSATTESSFTTQSYYDDRFVSATATGGAGVELAALKKFFLSRS